MIKIVNIIIPVYKAKDTLPRLLNSLYMQTCQEFVVTIVQDYDGESYSDLINEFRNKGLSITVIANTYNMGPGLSRQRGIDYGINTEYIMFCDSDDFLMPTAVEVLRNNIGDNDIAISSFYTYDNNKLVTIDSSSSSVTWLHGKLYRREFLVKNNIKFSELLRLNEDAYFNLVACNLTTKKIKIPDITYVWTYNENSLSRAGGVLKFFEKSWDGYVISQLLGILEISNKKDDLAPELVAMTLLNIYYAMVRAKYYEFDSKEFNEYFELVKKDTQIQDAISDAAFWAVIADKLKGSIYFNETLIFCDITFIDWIKMYIVGDNNDMDN